MLKRRVLSLFVLLILTTFTLLAVGQDDGLFQDVRIKVLISRELDSAGNTKGFDFTEVEVEAVNYSKILFPEK